MYIVSATIQAPKVEPDSLAHVSIKPPRFCYGVFAEYVDPADLPSFAGALYCSDDNGCGLFPVKVSTNFTGVYGTGNAVAAAVTEGSTTSSAPNRRHRRLTTAPLQEEGGDGFGTNYDDSDDEQRSVRVRKNSGLDALTSEQDMISMFLRRRYGDR